MKKLIKFVKVAIIALCLVGTTASMTSCHQSVGDRIDRARR